MSLHLEAARLFPYRSDYGLDHKAWAKRILWREERKDPELMSIQVKFAREAMGAKQEGDANE